MDLREKFFFVENPLELNKYKDFQELCIVKTNFSKKELEIIEKYKSLNLKTDFWIASNNVTHENIILANKIGIKNIIQYPINEEIVREYFEQKENIDKITKIHYDFSLVEGAKIVVVDDNDLNIELLQETLLPFNLEINAFLNPFEALDYCAKNKVDLMLFDVMMNNLSGFELYQNIKEYPVNSETPVIFISALSNSSNKVFGYNLGSFAFIEKPFDINTVRAQVYSILKQKKENEQKTTSKENFIAMITHDLKTPIHAKLLALNLLLKDEFGKLSSEQREILDEILKSTMYLQSMTENILTKYRFENGVITLNKEKICFVLLLQSCLEELKLLFEEKNQTIKTKLDLNDSIISIDLLQIKRVIINLLTNSSDYSPKGSEIILETNIGDKFLTFSIQDFGMGVNADTQENIFDKYVTTKNKENASGLGLYICKNIIEAHKGTISLESKKDFGTKFIINLPL